MVFFVAHSCSSLCHLCVGLISAFPMFGSSFFYIHSSSSTSFYAPCILAVSQQGLHFLHKSTHVMSPSHAYHNLSSTVAETRAKSKESVNCACFASQELMAAVPLVEVQATRTQRPSAGTSYPYVDITVGDMSTQRVVQLQLEQVLHHLTAQHSLFFPSVPAPHWLLCVRLQGLELCRVIAMQVENMMLVRDKRLTMPPSEITML